MIQKVLLDIGDIRSPFPKSYLEAVNTVSSSSDKGSGKEKFCVKIRSRKPGDSRFLSLKGFFPFKLLI